MASALDDVTPYYLYKIVNLVNGKLYIGVTKYPEKREYQHLRENRKNKNPLIKNAINKHGIENLKFEIICVGSQEYIYDLEYKAIISYDSINSGYNLSPGGKGGLGKKVEKRSDDYACYVYGFWFPNKRVACEVLNIRNTNVFYSRRKAGTLGETYNPTTAPTKDSPTYFKGFWFPTLRLAAEKFNKSTNSVEQAISHGRIEQNSSIKTQKLRRLPSINGVIYNSKREAASLLGIPYNTLRQYFYHNKEGYSYEYSN